MVESLLEKGGDKQIRKLIQQQIRRYYMYKILN